MPTKTLVASAYAAHLARRAADFGVAIEGTVTLDMKAVKARKDGVSTQARHGVETARGMARCTVYRGHARFRAAHDVEVGGEQLTASVFSLTLAGAQSPRIARDRPGRHADQHVDSRA